MCVSILVGTTMDVSLLLVNAARAGQLKEVQYLLRQRTVDINGRDDQDDNTALMWACHNGFHEIVVALLKHKKVDVNYKNRDGNTALMLASECKVPVMSVQEFLKQYKKPDNWNDVICEILVHGKVVVKCESPHDRDDSFHSVLGTLDDYERIVEELLKHDALDVNHKNELGNTALIRASDKGKVAIVSKLLQHSMVDANHQNNDGVSALIQASIHGRHEIVVQLLNHDGVIVNLQTKGGETALSLASKNGHTDTVSELLKHDFSGKLTLSEFDNGHTKSPGL